jgi:hypothetical protein
LNGEIVGSVTSVWWAIQFPDAPGFRHPVVLYDGAKNFLILALLLLLRKSKPARGILAAHFIFWYGFLRIFVDLFREYPTNLFGIATGQAFNLFMTVLGGFLLFWFSRKRYKAIIAAIPADTRAEQSPLSPRRLWLKRVVLVCLILFSLTLPSDWTQDIPARYGKRHAGIHYSRFYAHIEGNIPQSSK